MPSERPLSTGTMCARRQMSCDLLIRDPRSVSYTSRRPRTERYRLRVSQRHCEFSHLQETATPMANGANEVEIIRSLFVVSWGLGETPRNRARTLLTSDPTPTLCENRKGGGHIGHYPGGLSPKQESPSSCRVSCSSHLLVKP